MDGREINQQPREEPKEMILVKRGLFYFIGQLITFPFKMLYYIFSIGFGYLDIYWGWIKESNIIRKKRKKLNRYMDMARDEEIV